MKNMVRKIVGLALFLALPYAFAHSGHDHGHWSSSVIHALWISAALAIVALAYFIVKRHMRLRCEGNQSEEG